MGANIHAHIEVSKNHQWAHFAAPAVARHYTLYNLIAGIRDNPADNNPPVCKHFGLPDDISPVTRICHEQDAGYGLHHEGVLNADDIRELQDRLYDIYPETRRTGIDPLDLESSIFHTYIAGNCIASHQGFDDVRIVFWFDN